MERKFKNQADANDFARILEAEGGNRIESVNQVWGGYLVDWVEISQITAKNIGKECGYNSFSEMLQKNQENEEGYLSIINSLQQIHHNIQEDSLFLKVWNNSEETYEQVV